MPDLDAVTRVLSELSGLPVPRPNEQTEVALIGVWNAGKSTLLKRLLAEEKISIPSWLTVAAVRETNFVGEVSVGDVTFLDTPGLSAEIALHDGEAADGLHRADVVVVLLLPSLMTAEADEVLHILRGEHFHPAGWPWGQDGLRVLVTQLDQGGPNPRVDPDGFRAFAADKLSELQRILDERSVTIPVGPATIIADLNAEVSDDRDSLELDDYDRGDWDGVGEFLAWIHALPHDHVRRLGVARRLAHEAAEDIEARRRGVLASGREIELLEAAIESAEAQASEVRSQVEEARADLERSLDAFAASVYGGPGSEDDASLEQQHRAVIDDWVERYHERFDGLMVDSEMHLADGDVGPSRFWGDMQEVIGDKRFGKKSQEVIEHIFGAKIDVLRKEVSDAKTPAYWEKASRKFKTERQANIAGGVLIAGAGVGLLLETRAIVSELRSDPTPEHEKRAAKLRQRIREANAGAVEAAVRALHEHVSAVTRPLTDEIATNRELIERGRQRIEEERATLQAVDAAVQDVREAVIATDLDAAR